MTNQNMTTNQTTPPPPPTIDQQLAAGLTALEAVRDDPTQSDATRKRASQAGLTVYRIISDRREAELMAKRDALRGAS
jgi:hypothetical protein